MTLFICRHGRTNANAAGLLLGRADPSLDALGESQAVAVAKGLPSPTLVVTSPLRRCQQTAHAIASMSPNPVEIVVDDRWMELDYGDWDLTPVAEIPADTWRQWRADPHFRPPAGESLVEMAERVSFAIDDIADRAVADNIAVISHVSPIKAAVAWALAAPIEISWRCFVDQAAVTEIAVLPADSAGRHSASLRRFNDTSHLSEFKA